MSDHSPVLEVAQFQIHPEQAAEFEAAISQAYRYLTATPGYRDHQLRRCIEHPDQYLLTITWDTIEAHMVTFRESDNFQQWRTLIGPFFAASPQVLHYHLII